MKDISFWRGQISSAKGEHKKYFTDAKDCNEAYSKERSYNIFYSNVNTLQANLLTNSPKPDIQRRFLKRAESDKLKYNTYNEVAKITSGAIEYYSDMACLQDKAKKTIHNSVKIGRGVSWVEYEAKIGQDEMGQEMVEDRILKIHSLGYEDFLASGAEDRDSVWWVARRHLLSAEDLQERFGYEAQDHELNFGNASATSQKRAEVWEIWDKSSKKRMFMTTTGEMQDFLEVQDNPYKLEGFFPCDTVTWLTNGYNIIPIPEYKIYRKKAVELDEISSKAGSLEDQVKFVIAIGSGNKDTAQELIQSRNGDVVSIPMADPNANVVDKLMMLPVDGAIGIMNHVQVRKEELKQDIYDITGISDILRGQSDAQETATAQKIKGIFGSLRFQDRQKVVQNHIKAIYKIMVEIICEHWDEKTLSEITCTYLPTQEDKMIYKTNEANGIEVEPDDDTSEKPTWDDVLAIMRNDKLRNYTVDIETSSTVFDDQEMQTEAINNLTQSYLSLVQGAASLVDPNLIRGFLPIIKMNLSNIKVSTAISAQLEEALEAAYKGVEAKSKEEQPDPEAIKLQADLQEKEKNRQLEMIKLQNQSRELDIREQEVLFKKQYDDADIAIKQQEANRKDREMDAQVMLKSAEIQTGNDINSNISGEVASIE